MPDRSSPAPTAWPFLLALGMTLLFAALVTSIGIGASGLVLAVVSGVGWFRDVLPHEKHEDVPVDDEVLEISYLHRRRVGRIEVDETHRAQLPLQTFPISSGIKGGIAGGIAMVIPAEIYGILRLSQHLVRREPARRRGRRNWTNPTPARSRTSV